MAKLVWDKIGEHFYETGVDHGVLYPQNSSGLYPQGYAWNGLTTVTESPSGAEASPQYADNIKYLNLISAEEFGGTIEAFTYPDAWNECDGSASPYAGVTVGQQPRKSFGLVYRTKLGNDVVGQDFAYKLHLVWNALAAPSEKAYATVNDSPEATALSWEFSTTPVDAGHGLKPTSYIAISSATTPPAILTAIEDILFGTAGAEPRMPSPSETLDILASAPVSVTPTKPTQAGNVITIPTVTGVDYLINDAIVTGTATITKNTIVVARPKAGYTFPPNTDDDWLFIHT